MSPMRRHGGVFGLLLVAGLLIGGAIPVRAVSPVSFEDPAGDQLDLRPSMDILKVSWDVTQASTLGRPRIVVQIELAAPPEERLVNYAAGGDAGGGCLLEGTYHPGTVFTALGAEPAADFYVDCGHWDEMGQLVEARLETKGNVITMSIPLDSVPADVRRSGQLTELWATSELAEPMTGIVGTWWTGAGGADKATTDQTFRYA